MRPLAAKRPPPGITMKKMRRAVLLFPDRAFVICAICRMNKLVEGVFELEGKLQCRECIGDRTDVCGFKTRAKPKRFEYR